MAGNIFGQIFRVSTFGESHGGAIGCVIDGVPPNIILSEKDIQYDLDRRKPGQSAVTTSRQEEDQVEILSGVLEGRTTGTSLAMIIRNKDQQSQDYAAIKDIFRPGHADYTYFQKFGIRDYRGGGRSSGRETAARVAAGAVAKKILAPEGVRVLAYTLAVGDVRAESINYDVIEQNIMRAPDLRQAQVMIAKVNEVKAKGDSIGGLVEGVVLGCPVGLGDPVFDKLEARLAYAMLSIGAVKGIEFGMGFAAAGMMGSEHNDTPVIEDAYLKTKNNLAGGIIGGISTGEGIRFRIAVKPTSSIACPQTAAAYDFSLQSIQIQGRHDPCLCPRIIPVVEAMTALVLVDAFLIQKTIR
ncbi:MAG: chorismate synthase [Candidatus Omnitrophota bacterium]